MRFHQISILFVFAISVIHTLSAEQIPADALIPEHSKTLLNELNHPDFEHRERAGDELFGMGTKAIPLLIPATESPFPEVSMRAFEILQRLYQVEDEATIEEVERVLAALKSSGPLTIALRAERAFDSGAEPRQKRAIGQFQRLGGIVHYTNRGQDQQPLSRPMIEYFMIGREWLGGDEGLRLLTKIEDLHTWGGQLYIIRGIQVSDETLLDLRAELPFLAIQLRGPARLGIRGNGRGFANGCVIQGLDPGSAADLAGLRPLDQVTEIDGQPISSFEDLIEIVGEKEPGEQIPIVYRRGEKIHQVVATLSAWGKPAAGNGQPPQP